MLLILTYTRTSSAPQPTCQNFDGAILGVSADGSFSPDVSMIEQTHFFTGNCALKVVYAARVAVLTDK